MPKSGGWMLESRFAVLALVVATVGVVANLLLSSTSKTPPSLQSEHIPCHGQKAATTQIPAIPHTVHQIWIQGDPPKNYESFRRSWAEKHAEGWAMKLWNGDQLTELIGQKLPKMLPLYSRIENPAHKSDLGRYIILYLEGGLYADLDIESYRSFEPLLRGRSMLLFQEPAAHWEKGVGVGKAGTYTDAGKLISNSLIASVPGHPLWKSVIGHFEEQFQLVQVLLLYVMALLPSYSCPVDAGYKHGWDFLRCSARVCEPMCTSGSIQFKFKER
jgi:mannosyltransferase OCH1-like enzyme